MKKLIRKDSVVITQTVSTITPPSTPSVTSAASTEIMLPNGITEMSTPKSIDDSFKDVQSVSNDDNLDASMQCKLTFYEKEKNYKHDFVNFQLVFKSFCSKICNAGLVFGTPKKMKLL